MSALSIANACDFQQDREDSYLSIAKSYQKNELEGFARLFAMTVNAFEKNRKQDYLGAMFSEYCFVDEGKGQVFTPYHIAEFMTLASIDSTGTGYETVNDPCCGSGVMLIAATNRMIELNRNLHTSLFVVGQDIDYHVAMMAYIQLSLLGAAGYVVAGDSLLNPIEGNVLVPPVGAWCTPMFYHPVWQIRRRRNTEH